jgi:hypothetical protein
MTYRPPPKPSQPVPTSTCPHCHAPTLTGLEDGTGPHTATVNTQALTPTGELQALANGQHTYAHQPPYELQKRDAWRISHLNPQPTGYTIHATHICNGPTHDHYPPPPKYVKPNHTHPPY